MCEKFAPGHSARERCSRTAMLPFTFACLHSNFPRLSGTSSEFAGFVFREVCRQKCIKLQLEHEQQDLNLQNNTLQFPFISLWPMLSFILFNTQTMHNKS
jgi:hypothetical protein